MTKPSPTHRLLARALASTACAFDEFIQWQPLPHDTLELFDAVACPKKGVVRCAAAAVPSRLPESSLILLNGNLNHNATLYELLCDLKRRLPRSSRVVAILYNPYLRWVLRFAAWMGLRRAELPTAFTTRTDLRSLTVRAGFEVVREDPVLFFPFHCFGLGALVNDLFRTLPGLRWMGLVSTMTLRPVVAASEGLCLSVIVPARNEQGNIAGVIEGLSRTTDFVKEVIFVEGLSSDGTWEEINTLIAAYEGPIVMKAFQQKGRGKKDAVRLGLSKGTQDLLTVFDADLTVPPEALRQFYECYCNGTGDFVNGSRLVYPMENRAMPFANLLANVFFAKALSFVLGVKIGDSLCGTKLFSRRHYSLFRRWIAGEGDFDPFSDFELLLPAAALGIGIVDVPVHYRARRYGASNISRVRDGLLLLKMVLRGFRAIRMGRGFKAGTADLVSGDGATELRTLIRGKPALKAYYHEAYDKFAACLVRCPAGGNAVEIGSGTGFLRERHPQIMTPRGV